MKRLFCILSGMNMGGAETFLMKIYRNIDRSNYQMDFCINQAEHQDYEDEIYSLGGRIIRIPSKSEDLIGFKHGLYNAVKRYGYRYVLRITSNAMGFWDLKIARDAGAKITAARSSSAGGDLSIKSKIAHRIGRFLYGKYVNRKIAPSDLAAIHTFGERDYIKGNVFLLRNALDLNVFKFNQGKRLELRNKLCIPLNARVVGHVGGLRAEKNHKFLIDVFAECCKREDNMRLLLIGQGEKEYEIQKQVKMLNISDKVIMLGSRKDVSALLSTMDVFVMPSLYEGMPNAVIEAQAIGLPCIISDTITDEANITGLVNYLSLEIELQYWVDAIFCSFSKNRIDTSTDFIANGYEIKEVTKEFERIIFGNE